MPSCFSIRSGNASRASPATDPTPTCGRCSAAPAKPGAPSRGPTGWWGFVTEPCSRRANAVVLQGSRSTACQGGSMSSPSMTLFHSPTSPFVRKVMVLLHETGQLDRVALQEVQLSPTSPSAAVNAQNPAGKIPALRLADGSVLHDSRVILDYLDQQHVGDPLIPLQGPARWRRLTLASLADAILDEIGRAH